MRQTFDLTHFLPYLLNQAAEVTSRAFQDSYRDHGLTRTEWRVMANLAAQPDLTASDIGRITFTDKTKLSRAVQALADAGWLTRQSDPQDRRRETLALTDAGRILCRQIEVKALEFDAALRVALGPQAPALEAALRQLIAQGQSQGQGQGQGR